MMIANDGGNLRRVGYCTACGLIVDPHGHVCGVQEPLGMVTACAGTGEATATATAIPDDAVAAALELYQDNRVLGARHAMRLALQHWQPDAYLSEDQLDGAMEAYRLAEARRGEAEGMRAAMEVVRP